MGYSYWSNIDDALLLELRTCVRQHAVLLSGIV